MIGAMPQGGMKALQAAKRPQEFVELPLRKIGNPIPLGNAKKKYPFRYVQFPSEVEKSIPSSLSEIVPHAQYPTGDVGFVKFERTMTNTWEE